MNHPIILKTFIADNPKRAFIRDSLSNGAKYACEYCFSNGVIIKDSQPSFQQDLSTLQTIKSNETNEEHIKVLDNYIQQVQRKKNQLQ